MYVHVRVMVRTDEIRSESVFLQLESFEVFHTAAAAVVQTFVVMSTERTWNTESSTKAASLLLSITQFEFFYGTCSCRGLPQLQMALQ